MKKQPNDLWELIDAIDCENTWIGQLLAPIICVANALDKRDTIITDPALYANTLYVALEQLQASQKKIQDLADQGFTFARAQRTAATVAAAQPAAP